MDNYANYEMQPKKITVIIKPILEIYINLTLSSLSNESTYFSLLAKSIPHIKTINYFFMACAN